MPDFAASAVVELRQYTLHPGRRHVLVEVFEANFVEGQEDVGIAIGGLYEDELDPDRFVWMRGWPDLGARLRSLQDFYFGQVWAEHREVANGTMIDSTDVLLLRPTAPAHAPAPPRAEGPAASRARVLIGVHVLTDGVEDDLAVALDVLERKLGVPIAAWRSHPGPNDFPRLPVRDDLAFVWQAVFPDEENRTAALTRLDTDQHWRIGEVTLLKLRPTRRSKHPAG